MTYFSNYHEWRKSITTKGGLTLDFTFCNERINTFQNDESPETHAFIKNYGEQHRQQIIRWFQKALSEL